MPPPPVLRAVSLACFLLTFAATGCRRGEAPAAATVAHPRATLNAESFRPQAIGAPVRGKPWVAHVTAVDLDHDGLVDVLACESQTNEVVWIRQTSPGTFAEEVLAHDIKAPVHVEAVDLDGDGDLDLLVASMGQIYPNNDTIGSTLIFENNGRQQFTKHVIEERTFRVTDVRAGDFNHDGRLDLAVAKFGYDQGEICWLENLGDWRFRRHDLLHLSGAINVCVADFNADGHVDIAGVVSQQWEEVHLFTNDGAGNFSDKVIFGSTNEDFGSSGISVCDLNRDGRPDVLYTNGDGFDYAEPGARPWHGVQWLENTGGGNFRYHRIGNLPGAYSPVGIDLDGDGFLDVAAVSGFNDWTRPDAASLVVFQNDGRMNFTTKVLAYVPTHFTTLAAGDLEGNGQLRFITGGFHAYGPWEHLSRVSVWRPTATTSAGVPQ